MIEGQSSTRSVRSLVIACVIYFLLMPGLIPLHELAHYSCAKSYGWNANIQSIYTTWSETPLATKPAKTVKLHCTAVGPLFDYIIALIGAAILFSFLKSWRSNNSENILFWLASLCCVKGLRSFRIQWQGSGDELFVSQALWRDPMLLNSWLLLVSTALLIILLWVHFRTQTLIQLFAAYCAGVLGVGIWINMLGPAIFGE